MKIKLFFTILLIVASAFILPAQDTVWDVDHDHSSLRFNALYMGIGDIVGVFKEYSLKVVTSGGDFDGANIEVVINAESIDTDNAERDEHLLSEDFLYVEEYPRIIFRSTSFEKIKENEYMLKGDLTIRGITRTEEFEVLYKGMVDTGKKKRAAFRLTGSVDRYDYHVDWNKSFLRGLVVGKTINIVAEMMLFREAD